MRGVVSKANNDEKSSKNESTADDETQWDRPPSRNCSWYISMVFFFWSLRRVWSVFVASHGFQNERR